VVQIANGISPMEEPVVNDYAKTSKPPAINAGLVSSARTMACSVVMAYVPVSGRYWTYPAAAWAASHSRT
jgi:hypothetical protein